MKKGNNKWIILIIIIGICFIIYGLLHVALGFFGEEAQAVILNIRRQGGQRNEAIPNRYTYAVSYSFTLPDGKTIEGSTYKIDDSVFVKVTPINNGMVSIKYFKFLPYINALKKDTGIGTGSILLVGVGIFIIWFVAPHNPKCIQKRTRFKTKKKN